MIFSHYRDYTKARVRMNFLIKRHNAHVPVQLIVKIVMDTAR